MVATLACARAGVTIGEWAGALREVFGEYRAPTGVSGAARRRHSPDERRGAAIAEVRERVRAHSASSSVAG